MGSDVLPLPKTEDPDLLQRWLQYERDRQISGESVLVLGKEVGIMFLVDKGKSCYIYF